MRILLSLIILIFSQTIWANKRVAITIDDAPNVSLFRADGHRSKLLEVLDSIQIPIAVFLNESNIYKNEFINENFDLLKRWVNRPYVTVGNHSFSHQRYSDIGFEKFKIEIDKGEAITRELAKFYNKTLTQFRFPYNDLGLDSNQHMQIANYLTQKGYKITPFTIESSDWVFNYLYEYYLEKKDSNMAVMVGREYVKSTLILFDYFDSLSHSIYQRQIDQIYLCHDNRLNADYIEELIGELMSKGYDFVSLENAMNDEIYSQKDIYYKKWGISWIYRWESGARQKSLMMNEPSLDSIYQEYDKLKKK